MPKYRWDNPYEWLKWATSVGQVHDWELLDLIGECAVYRQIQHKFEDRMDEDLYFKPLKDGVSDDVSTDEPTGHGEGAL